MKKLSHYEMETIVSGKAENNALGVTGCIVGLAGIIGGFVVIGILTAGGTLTTAGALLFAGEHVVADIATGLGCGSLLM